MRLRSALPTLLLFAVFPALRAQQPAPCAPQALQAAAPAGLTIANLPTFSTRGVKLPAPADGIAPVADPAACLITGTVLTNPATGKTAGFAALLPAQEKWNGRFLFVGCGGTCGRVGFGSEEVALAARGFTVWKTDDGHAESETDWALKAPGTRNEDALDDFAYRAVHTTTELGKAFATRYYSQAKITRSYYEGCSDGGREGMVSAARFPDDFDGLLVGAPYFDVPGQALTLTHISAQLRAPGANLSGIKLKLASQIALAQCDGLDGVKDNLIQNPAFCAFNPMRDLPRCEPGQDLPTCYTQAQAESLSVILAAITDPIGGVIHPGYSVSDLTDGRDNLTMYSGVDPMPAHPDSPTPWGTNLPASNYGAIPMNAALNTTGIHQWVYAADPKVDPLHFAGITFTSSANAAVTLPHATLPEAVVRDVYAQMNRASADFPAEFDSAFAKDKKILLYHGLSDGLITPFRTVQFVEEMAERAGGFDKLAAHLVLYLAPGMAHCGGGPGPNNFGQSGQPVAQDPQHDALTALLNWVEKNEAPGDLIATHQEHNAASPLGMRENQSAGGSPAVRSMPLCRYPAMARYNGSGDVKEATSWSCPVGDVSMQKIGFDGIQAGAIAPLFTGTSDHSRTGKPVGLASQSLEPRKYTRPVQRRRKTKARR